ncbi:MAG: hypothetical protein ACKOE4_01275 [Candidatus Kapaibacterium sp.]
MRHHEFWEAMMNPLLRPVLAVLSGVIASGLVVAAIEMLGHSLFMNGAPMPSTTDPSAVNAYSESLGFGVLVSLLIAWCAGAYVGSMVAMRIARGDEKRSSMVIGGFVLAGAVMNFFQFPHPAWLMVSAVILIPVCAWLAIRRSTKVAP